VYDFEVKMNREQGRPEADEAALGPAPWCLGRLFIFARYSLRCDYCKNGE